MFNYGRIKNRCRLFLHHAVRCYASVYFSPNICSILIRRKKRCIFLELKSSTEMFNLISLHHNRPYLTFEQIGHFAPVIKMFVINVIVATISAKFRSIFVGESDKFYAATVQLKKNVLLLELTAELCWSVISNRALLFS